MNLPWKSNLIQHRLKLKDLNMSLIQKFKESSIHGSSKSVAKD